MFHKTSALKKFVDSISKIDELKSQDRNSTEVALQEPKVELEIFKLTQASQEKMAMNFAQALQNHNAPLLYMILYIADITPILKNIFTPHNSFLANLQRGLYA